MIHVVKTKKSYTSLKKIYFIVNVKKKNPAGLVSRQKDVKNDF